LATALTDETGTGANVFGTGPTISSPIVSAQTNSDGTASTFVVLDATKKMVSTGTSAALAATLSDETGTGLSVFATGPTMSGVNLNGLTSLQGDTSFGTVTPAQITSSQNDYNPAGFSSGATVMRLSTDASRNITGIQSQAGWTNRMLVIENVGSFPIVLKNQDSGSATTNRIKGYQVNDVTILQNDTIMLFYDLASSNWRVVGPAGTLNMGAINNLTGTGFVLINGVGTLGTTGGTSAQLAAAMTDETGAGAAVFGTGPTIASPVVSAQTNSDLTASTFVAVDSTKKMVSTATSAALATTLSDDQHRRHGTDQH